MNKEPGIKTQDISTSWFLTLGSIIYFRYNKLDKEIDDKIADNDDFATDNGVANFFQKRTQAKIKALEEEELDLGIAKPSLKKNKTDAKKAKLDVEKSSHQIAEVRAMALPQINLNGGLTYNPILQKRTLQIPNDKIDKLGEIFLSPSQRPSMHPPAGLKFHP